MGDGNSDESSDELYSSYKNDAKRTYEAALRRAAEVEITSVQAIVSVESSDSDNCQPIKKKVFKKKRRDDQLIITRKRKKELTGEVSTSTVVKKQELCYEVLSSDNESLNGSVKIYEAPTSVKKSSTCSIVKQKDVTELDYDTEPESESTKEIVILSDSSDIEELSPNISKHKVEKYSNELMSIKISWRFQPLQKFQLRRHQKFKSLLEHFAELEGVPIEQVVIHGGKDSWRSIEPYDTPDSIGITVADILEGGVLANGSTKHSSMLKRYRNPSEADGEEIELKVQQEQTRSFPLLIKRHQKMSVLFIKVAEQLEIDLDKVKLFIDGEVIAPNSTPEDLDLDDGDVLDMVMV